MWVAGPLGALQVSLQEGGRETPDRGREGLMETGRDWNKVAISQGMSSIAATRNGRDQEKDCPLEPLEGTNEIIGGVKSYTTMSEGYLFVHLIAHSFFFLFLILAFNPKILRSVIWPPEL